MQNCKILTQSVSTTFEFYVSFGPNQWTKVTEYNKDRISK